MGEAKRRQQQEIETFLEIMKPWIGPTSAWEKNVVREISQLPVVHVCRLPLHTLADMGMEPNCCHENCAWLEENDPHRRARSITGWLRDPTGNYVLHAVILVNGKFTCITPTTYVNVEGFDFVPDIKIVISRTSEGDFRFCRDGHPIGAGVRVDPAATIAYLERIKQRLEEGMPLADAMSIPFEHD